MLRLRRPAAFLMAFASAGFLLFVLFVPFAPSAQQGEGGEPGQAGAPPDLRAGEHEWLARDAGTWAAKCTLHGPTGDIEFTGIERVSVDCGGLWVFSQFEGDLFGAPFKGRGVTGYDPETKKVLGAWVDSQTTTIARFEGEIRGEELVMTTEGRDPETGERYPERHVQTRQGADQRTLKMYALRGGQEHLLMEVAYTRTK
jgi:hypothetical protein